MAKFWIGVAHARQVGIIREKALVAFSRGQKAPVARMAKGDRVAYYAPRTDFEGDPVQAFVALATVTDAAPFEAPLVDEATAWVRAARYRKVREAPVKPMLDELSFVTNPRHWGMAFRRSHFEVTEADFARIARAMGA